jgi:hypothetical protein
VLEVNAPDAVLQVLVVIVIETGAGAGQRLSSGRAVQHEITTPPFLKNTQEHNYTAKQRGLLQAE